MMAAARFNRVLGYLHDNLGPDPGPGASDSQLLGRFITAREETAFAGLLHRHGPMVLGLCRRLLHDPHEAEDVCQATFLVLARRAGSVRKRDSVASFLYGVAYRLALRTRAQRVRRSLKEQQAPTTQPPAPPVAAAWNELQAALEEELQRLPEKLRSPLILCHLEGHSHEEAACLLGCPLGTVRSRVARARERLRQRLCRRGLALSATAFGSALLANTATAALPETLAAATADAAVRITLTGTLAGAVPTEILALVREGARGLLLAKLKAAALALAACVVLAVGVGLAMHRPAAAPGPEPDSKPVQPLAAPAVAMLGAGDPLPAGALSRLGTLRLRVGSSPLTSDGKLLAVPFFQKVDLMDARTGDIVRTLKPGLAGAWAISGVTFAPDGKTLAVAGFDNHVRLMATDTGKLLANLDGPPPVPGHSLYLSAPVFSANSKVVAIASVGYGTALPVYVWNVATGKQLGLGTPRLNHSVRFALSPDGSVLATWAHHIPTKGEKETNRHQGIQLWELGTGKELHRLACEHLPTAPVTAAFSTDGKQLAVRSGGSKVDIWDVASGERLRRLDGPPASDGIVTFSPDGKLLAVGASDGSVALSELGKWSPLDVAKPPHCQLVEVLFPTPGKVVGHGYDGQALVLWDVKTGEVLPQRQGHTTAVATVAFGADGKQTCSASQDGKVCFVETSSGKLTNAHRLTVTERDPDDKAVVQPAHCRRLALSPDGKYLAGDLTAGTGVRIWESATGKQVSELPVRQIGEATLRFSPDGRTLAILDCRQHVGLWNVRTGAQERSFNTDARDYPIGAGPEQLAFSGDGRLLAAVTRVDNQEGKISEAAVWEIATGKKLLGTKQTHLLTVALSFDGTLLATGGRQQVRLYRTDTGKQLPELADVRGNVPHLAFSPDGRSLAGACEVFPGYPPRYELALWEVATGQPRRHFTGHEGKIEGLAFSPDGSKLVTASEDTTVVVWDATGRALADTASSRPEYLWADLAADLADRAFPSMGALVASPSVAIPLLKDRLRPKPATAVSAEQLQGWISDLDSGDFAVRQKASEQLTRLGALAVPALRRALEGSVSPEQRKQISQLLAAQVASRLPAEDLRALRGLEVLERIGSAEAVAALEALARGPAGDLRTKEAKAALARLRR